MIYNKKYFIITAHPDDLEMSCAGLVAKVNKHGGSVTNLILVKPSGEANPSRDEQKVKLELSKSKEILKVETIIYDTPLHDNGRPNLQISNNLVTYAESLVKDHDILLSH